MSVDIDQLVAQAWSDVDAMQVLVDYLLEKGEITQEVQIHSASWYDGHFPLETKAREWILNRLLERLGELELRVTGGWPDLFYTVYRTMKPSDWTLADRVKVFGVTKQPRLLRAHVKASCQARISTSGPAEWASNERPREAGLERGGSGRRST